MKLRGLLTVVLFAVASLLAISRGVAYADAMTDYFKTLEKNRDHPDQTLCRFLTQNEVARYLGEPVGAGKPVATVCQFTSLNGSDEVQVEREKRDGFIAPTSSPQYKTVSGVGERAFTYYHPRLGYEAEALNARGTTIVIVSSHGNAATALALLKLAMQR